MLTMKNVLTAKKTKVIFNLSSFDKIKYSIFIVLWIHSVYWHRYIRLNSQKRNLEIMLFVYAFWKMLSERKQKILLILKIISICTAVTNEMGDLLTFYLWAPQKSCWGNFMNWRLRLIMMIMSHIACGLLNATSWVNYSQAQIIFSLHMQTMYRFIYRWSQQETVHRNLYLIAWLTLSNG